MGGALVWDRDGRDWPHHDASRFVDAGGVRWHVQWLRQGRGGPLVLLLHGTGASTHSWRALMDLLAPQFSVLAVDLPGHAFTGVPADARTLGLPGMATALAALLRELQAAPAIVVGHSAGAAVALRLALDGNLTPAALVSVNGALLPLGGWAGPIFSPVARLLALNPWVPRLFSWRASDPVVLQRLLDGTGSRLDAAGRALYGRLLDSPVHVAGALGMMARWDLHALARELPRLRIPLYLIVGEHDRTLPPDQAWQVRERVPGPGVVSLPGLGHLAHEEDSQAVAVLLRRIAADSGVLRDTEVVNLT